MSAIAVKIQVPMLIKKANSKKKYAPSLLLFWDLIWRINLEAQHLHFLFAHPTVYKIQPGRAIAQPPQMLAFTALLSLQCHNPVAQHTAAAALREKQLSGGAFPLKRASLTQRRTVVYHIQGATKPCSRNHYNDFTANGLKC